MATTIQVSEETLAALKAVKERMEASSYDEVVRRLLMTQAKQTMKLRGLAAGLGPFVRDHNDRD